MRKTGAFAALLFLLALAAISSHDAARATSFVPIDHTVALANAAPSANSSLTVSITLDSPAALDQAHVSFIPSAWSVANDAAVPNGAIVGTVSMGISESVSNGPCNDSKFLSFTLYDSATDTVANLLADSPRIPSATWPGFADSNANGLADAIDKYPTFLKNAYPGLTPRSRAYGSVPAAIGGINRVVNVLVFDPGTALPGMSPISASLGYIVVVVAQDPTAPPAVSTISDQCSTAIFTRQDRGLTQDNINTAANEGGVVYRTNPSAAGTYPFMEYFRSLRDIDNDGIENSLDSCPYVSTPTWNPRISDAINDPDADGIPGQDNLALSGEQLLAGSGCDPTPLTAATDPDGDGFTNRQDNCPLVANATQVNPDADGIGSACDSVDTVGDGHLHEICSSVNVNVGTPGTPATLTCPEFVPDVDNDGYDRLTEEHVGTGVEDPCGNDGWPADLYSLGSSANDVDVQDITSFLAPVRRLDTSPPAGPGSNYNVRWDLVPGPGLFSEHINVQDITNLIVLHAPMHEGVRAFGGPACPWP
ncbi:MAG TPA: thrombospondin type 3 repeat-containing protein [Dehalococcoidia bacterium]|nr:thrombospondin type 3 repeat-containing protein [Dehalococcoidia bacterium]